MCRVPSWRKSCWYWEVMCGDGVLCLPHPGMFRGVEAQTAPLSVNRRGDFDEAVQNGCTVGQVAEPDARSIQVCAGDGVTICFCHGWGRDIVTGNVTDFVNL